MARVTDNRWELIHLRRDQTPNITSDHLGVDDAIGLSKTLGFVEAIGLASAVLSLLGHLEHVSSLLNGSSKKSRLASVNHMIVRLNSGVFKSNAKTPGPVLDSLHELVEIAKKLQTRASSDSKMERIKSALKDGRFEKQLDKLRKGIDDIEKALMVDSPHKPDCEAPAASQSVIYIAAPVTINVFEDNGQVPGRRQNIQPSTVAAVAYRPAAPIGYPSIGYPPIDQPAFAAVVHPPAPPIGYPPIGYLSPKM